MFQKTENKVSFQKCHFFEAIVPPCHKLVYFFLVLGLLQCSLGAIFGLSTVLFWEPLLSCLAFSTAVVAKQDRPRGGSLLVCAGGGGMGRWYAHTHTHTCAHTSAYTCTHKHACKRAHMHTCACTSTHTRLCTKHTQAHPVRTELPQFPEHPLQSPRWPLTSWLLVHPLEHGKRARHKTHWAVRRGAACSLHMCVHVKKLTCMYMRAHT